MRNCILWENQLESLDISSSFDYLIISFKVDHLRTINKFDKSHSISEDYVNFIHWRFSSEYLPCMISKVVFDFVKS